MLGQTGLYDGRNEQRRSVGRAIVNAMTPGAVMKWCGSEEGVVIQQGTHDNGPLIADLIETK